jgi:hypothetical protein
VSAISRFAALQIRADSAELILSALLGGEARIEPATREFCFRGIRYTVGRPPDWGWTVKHIGRDKLEAAR